MILKQMKIFSALTAMFLVAGSAFAAPSTWNVDADGDWNVAGNWDTDPGVPGVNYDTAVFGSVITAPRTVTAVSPTANDYFPLTAIELNSAESYTIAPSAAVDNFIDFNTATSNINSMSGSHTIAVPLNVHNTNTLNVNVANAPDTLTISGTIMSSHPVATPALTSALVKTGEGTLILSKGQSSYTGATMVNAGTLKLIGKPQPLAGAQLWLDASDASTITKAGTDVSAWANKGTQGGTYNGSATQDSTINGLSVMSFDGIFQGMTSTDYTNNTESLSLFAVLRRESTLPDYRGPMAFVGQDPANLGNGSADWDNHWSIAIDSNGDGTQVGFTRDFAGKKVASPANGTPYTLGVISAPHPGSNTLFINGVDEGFDGGQRFYNVLGSSMGQRVSRNGDGTLSTGGNWNGDIAEVLAYNATLSAADRQTVEAYLNYKWYGIGTGYDNILPTSTDMTVAAGATLDLNGANQALGSLSGAVGSQVLLGNGNLAVGSNNIPTTFNGMIDGSGTLTKNGSAALVLTGANAYTGATTINEGNLTVNGSLASSMVMIVSGAILSGDGTVNSVEVSGIVSPGNSTGTLTTGSQIWNANGQYQWELSQSDGVKGTVAGWDWINISGSASTLAITATSATPFTIDITGSGVANWDSNGNYSWIIASAEGGISGFSADKFSLNTSNFSETFIASKFSLSQSGNNLVLNYVPEPGTIVLLITALVFGGSWTLLRRRQKVS